MPVRRLDEEHTVKTAAAPVAQPLTLLEPNAPQTQLRGLAWLSFTDTGHVGSKTIVSDAGGGGTATWTYGTGVPCRIDPLSGDERVTAGRISERSTHMVSAPPETAVAAANRILIDGRGTYEVTAVPETTGGPIRFVEVVEVT